MEINFTGKEIRRGDDSFREIETYFSEDLKAVSHKLRECNKLISNTYAEFNGNILYSDETEDEHFLKVTGKTVEDFEKYLNDLAEKYIEEEKMFEKKKPSLIEEYINKGHEILDEKYHNEWDRIVPIRVSDIYHGLELDSALKVIKMLKNGVDRDTINKALDEDGHSGMSYGLTVSLIRKFSDEGMNFK